MTKNTQTRSGNVRQVDLNLSQSNSPMERVLRWASFMPLLVVAVLGTAALMHRHTGTGAGMEARGDVGMEALPDRYDPHLIPTYTLILQRQGRYVKTLHDRLQETPDPSGRIWAMRSYLEGIHMYNAIASRMPAKLVSEQHLPRFISLPAIDPGSAS